ncbi:Vacuolar protein sorting-associated protein VTA1 [Trichostrongylus colubriformis]|uniref:Vacuolar protein sorting-associated protein VTA1 n=1 Tax=Trichostrongylus colubriformis TaxID=6319 RepID=A0AAN8FJ78_TRICO
MAANVPASLKPIAHYIKIANENSSRDPVVYYWCLFYAVQNAMHLDKSSPEALKFLTGLLSTLETIKKQLVGNEAITNEVVAQAHLEDFALKLFNFADAREKAGQVDKSVVHAFYTAGHIMDVLSLFGEVEEPFLSSKKYAKWKSTQIFSCLKEGKPYVPSSQPEEEFSDASSGGAPAPVEQKYPDTGSTSSSGNYQPQPGTTNYGGGSFTGSHSSLPSTNYGFAGLPTVPGVPNAAPTSQTPPVPQHNYNNPTPMNTIVPEMSGLNIDGEERKPSVEAFNEARKFTKYALSAIDYEDTRAVVENLRKALALMERF